MLNQLAKRRQSRQRDTVLKVLRGTKSHPTADWIYEQVKREIPNVSLGTVYRNLRLLKEAGEILELDFGAAQSRFDGNPKPHYHLVCVSCGSVLDVDMPVKRSLDEEASESSGLKVLGHRLEFYGVCSRCAEPTPPSQNSSKMGSI
ncbi:MAG TPA: transcriptional repressor [Clostridia bacterium]|nr:transcriptional repressor [Clostridia bacterium]